MKEKLEAAKKAGSILWRSVLMRQRKDSRVWILSQAERMEMLNLMRIVGIPIRTMCLSGHRKYPLGSHDIKMQQKAWKSWKRRFDLQMILVFVLFSLLAMMSIMKILMKFPGIILSGI